MSADTAQKHTEKPGCMHEGCKREYERLFSAKAPQKLGRQCNLELLVPALNGKGYMEGSLFDRKFTSLDDNLDPVDAALRLEMSTCGTAAYKRLESAPIKIYTLIDIDSVQGGRRVRKNIEIALGNITIERHGTALKMQSQYVWSVQLISSMSRYDGSVLVLRLDCEDILPRCPPGALPEEMELHEKQQGLFIVVASSGALCKDAGAVAQFMRDNGYRNVEFSFH